MREGIAIEVCKGCSSPKAACTCLVNDHPVDKLPDDYLRQHLDRVAQDAPPAAGEPA